MEKQELMDLLFAEMAEQEKKWKIEYSKGDYNKALQYNYGGKVLNDFATKINSMVWKQLFSN